MAGRLAGKRIFVTAAGQGMGRASALAMAAEGASVVATDRDLSKLAGLAEAGIETHALDVLDDAAVIAIVDKLIKQRKDSITAFASAGRTDLVVKESAELAVLQAYLPARLSADEITAAVGAIVASLNASGPGDMGKVMAAVKAQLAGKADMGAVSAAVKAALSK
jgi:uncharacterized protein YqeY